MSDLCLSCSKNHSIVTKVSSNFKAKISGYINKQAAFKSVSSIRANSTVSRSFNKTLSCNGSVKPKSSVSFNPKPVYNIEFNIAAKSILQGNGKARIISTGQVKDISADKFAGYLGSLKNITNFNPSQKLYPIKDIVTNYNNSFFVNKELSNSGLFNSIDEGVFIGNYILSGKTSKIISDEKQTYIQPSSIFTSGDFRYKCEITKPLNDIQDSFLFIRASAPVSNYASDVPPQYKIHNIRLEDPSGNLIIKYKDITLRGDADYSNPNYINFATYITEPEVNNFNNYTWVKNYPISQSASGYTLNLDFNIQCLDEPFNIGFDKGYEDTCKLDIVQSNKDDYLALGGSPLSTQSQNFALNPTNSIRISAIEIANFAKSCVDCSGRGIILDNYLSFATKVDIKGRQLVRILTPASVLNSSFDAGIYPSSVSVWESSEDGFYNTALNTTNSGSVILTQKLQNTQLYDYIKLISTSISDSGKLTLKFSHTPPRTVQSYRDGAFEFGTIDFDRANVSNVPQNDNFFVVDNIYLKVIAKKAIGTRDYVLDVVGYSDDKLLNVTPKRHAFLQNTEDAQADDHYSLSTYPIVSGTTFQEYTIPLTINEDNVSLGKSTDYRMSSYFENLYLDIYPIPSGASIASIQMFIEYVPTNALTLHTLGQEVDKAVRPRTYKLYPSPSKANDSLLNSDYTDYPLSKIENIPHAFDTPDTIKTNYSRRWKGIDGLVVSGPYSPNEFDFSFFNPEQSHPFLNGYFTFNNDVDSYIVSDSTDSFNLVSGLYQGNYSKIRNLGLRFNNSSLFTENTNYKTIDWTSINGYENHELYGKILDAYDNVIRVSGSTGYIDFGNIDSSSGFAIYVRFSPDITISGVDYNLFNSGVLFSKWDENSNLEFALGYNDGYLTGYARDSDDNIITVTDSIKYDEYQYPLSTILTYNDNNSNKLRLYTDNELSNFFECLRDFSESFVLSSGDSKLTVGYSLGSGVGINAFISEIGISTYNDGGANLLASGDINRELKQTYVNSFLGGRRNIFNKTLHPSGDRFSLWSFVDDNTDYWHLGDFNSLMFSPVFDRLTQRDSSDFIIHNLKHDGSPYFTIVDLALPSSVLASGLSYHTQIENDFLRFNLSDIEDSKFYATTPRICKTLPRGYDFTKQGLIVDTIVQHETLNNIVWPDNNIGPKLIVSLYTINQNPVDRPSKINWGLINRAIHYIRPSGGFHKLTSKFTYNDLIDTSEPWANFDLDRNTIEFDHKYYSKDINDMFLQYDLVYPSGEGFESTIKLHSCHVKLEGALVKGSEENSTLPLISKSEKLANLDINLFIDSFGIRDNSLTLFSSGDYNLAASSVMSLHCSGATLATNRLQLFVMNSGNTLDSMLLYVNGRYNKFNEENLPLIVQNNIIDQTSSGSLSLYTKNIVTSDFVNNSFNISMRGASPLIDYYPSEFVSLFINVPSFEIKSLFNTTNLFINTNDDRLFTSGTCNLYLNNYLLPGENVSRKAYFAWNSQSSGSNIEVDDNIYASLAANDEIRGVDLLCYGPCSGNASACTEKSFVLHNIPWTPEVNCLDGGVIRAKNVYTNLETSGFNSPIGYSGHFYGIRKYTNLIPNSQYSIVVEGTTGSSNHIKLPRILEEVEYGTNDIVAYSGSKLTVDYNSNYTRQENDQYGKSVSVVNNIAAVGAPKHNLQHSYYNISGIFTTAQLQEAGAVFVYRREDRPSGYSWPSNKAKSPWILDAKVTLPSGFTKDYYTEQFKDIGAPLPIIERYWKLGQEGRQFGHSVSVGIDNTRKSFMEDSRQVMVVGAPSAKWTPPDFQDIEPSSVQIGLMIFSDEFVPTYTETSFNCESKVTTTNVIDYNRIISATQNKDLLFKYFSSPSVKFNTNVIILEPLGDFTTKPVFNFPEPKPSFITKKTISRNQGSPTEARTELMFNQMKDAFHESFPYDNTKLNNNIPVMLGISVDNSRSLGTNALEPALARFINYYRNYAFASGLVDFYGSPSNGIVYVSTSNQEQWIYQGIELINNLLDTGRLISNNEIRYFTSGVGLEFFNTNLAQFNYPPDSGGRVYIFERESGSWNLIQEIESPNKTYGQPDRFGHSVAISKNTDIVAIGSPYINNALQIYEYNDLEKVRLINNIHAWLLYKSSLTGGNNIRYVNLINSYSSWVNQYGGTQANNILYSQLSSTEKFEARRYLNIQEYRNIYNYSYSDIPLVGEKWLWIPDYFLPTSRLGYDVAVNEDGSIIACGAPTDSMNQWEDGNIYYKNRGYLSPDNTENLNTNSAITPAWASNVNAGAVRVFESRSYYPHNKVVDFTKFGNLHKSLNDPLDSGHFSYIDNVFKDLNFVRTEFTDPNIPQDAGLVFITTPEVDALSDEVSDNIINWLSLGDRNLVLVGNDPVWESSGVYNQSNIIINKILARLDSRLRLHQARNSNEALVTSSGLAVPSIDMMDGTTSYVSKQTLNSYGAADIRVHIPGFDTLHKTDCGGPLKTEYEFSLYGSQQPCSLPLVHNGDLRAQWTESCVDCSPEPKQIIYPVNWAYMFKTSTPLCCGDPFESSKRKNWQGQDPIPLLVAASNYTYRKLTPAIPPESGIRIKSTQIITTKTQTTKFDESILHSGISLIWSDTSGNYSGLSTNLSNVIPNNSLDIFYKPALFENRQSILQANAIPETDITLITETVQEKTYYALEDKYQNTTSNIVVIAGLNTESKDLLYGWNNYDKLSTDPFKGSNTDTNINFYHNLVSKNINGGASIAQLGGWTGRSSFQDAFADSALLEVFLNNGNNVDQNVTKLYGTYDVCWIANPSGLPSSEDMMKLKSWLNLGNKRLVITFGDPQNNSINTLTSQTNIAKELLSLLNSNIRPLYLPNNDTYDIVPIPSKDGNVLYNDIKIDTNHPISLGFDYDNKTFITKFILDPLITANNCKTELINLTYGYKSFNFTGLEKLSSEVKDIAYISRGVKDISSTEIVNTSWRLDSGLAKVTFPTIQNSGYKIFINTVSETPSENQPLNIIGTNFSTVADPNINQQLPPVIVYGINIDNIGYSKSIENDLAPNIVKTTSFNIRANSDNISFYVYAKNPNINIGSAYIPKTTRLLSISGVPVSLINTLEQTQVEIPVYESYLISSGIPAKNELVTAFGPIATDSSKYICCSSGVVEDGPVLVAQETEHLSSFLHGFNRSRITILSDSSLIQGRYAGNNNRAMSASTYQFIRSLYPFTNFVGLGRKQYQFTTKLVAPDRGSAGKYKALVQNSGLSLNFGNLGGSGQVGLFTDKDSRYDPNFVIKPLKEPWEPEEGELPKTPAQIELIKQTERDIFSASQSLYGLTSRFSGIINDKIYVDAGRLGGIPELMKDTGYDYLDFDVHYSGYPGDLFGYSLGISENKIIVGSPFHGYSENNITNWSNITSNKYDISHNGGAGAVYVFEKTFNGSGLNGTTTEWECVQKLRPSSISAGSDSGNNIIGDRFGYDIDISYDAITIGAPGHDWDNYIINNSNSGEFIRKDFNKEFFIPNRQIFDLGYSGNRLLYGSGNSIVNNGSVFVYENSINDWVFRNKRWELIEKITPQGLNASGENNLFGKSVSLDRSNRTDSDYTAFIGIDNHTYDSSGYNSITNAGASFTYDMMIREQPPAVPSPSSFIQARVFGDTITSGIPSVFVNIINSNDNSKQYYTSGVVYTNSQGEIFIEVSGQDLSQYRFIEHRPYISNIDGLYSYGIENSSILPLYIDGKIDVPDNMNLFSMVENSSLVYNNLGLYTSSIIDFATNLPSGLWLYNHSPDPAIVSSSGLFLATSGIGNNNNNILMYIRGK